MRGSIFVVLCLLVHPLSTFAEVTSVTVTSRTLVAGGQSFGTTGPYERLVGRIEFALDPDDPHNAGIVDLNHAPRDADGRVRFSSDLYVLRPTDPSKGNGVLLFEVANRGRRTCWDGSIGPRQATSDHRGRFRRRPADAGRLHVGVDRMGDRRPRPAAPDRRAAGTVACGSDDRLSVEIMHNERVSEVFLVDDPAGRPPVIYPPADSQSPTDVLTVRDRFWDAGERIPRDSWRFIVGPNNLPKLQLETGFRTGAVLSRDLSRYRSAGGGRWPRRDP